MKKINTSEPQLLHKKRPPQPVQKWDTPAWSRLSLASRLGQLLGPEQTEVAFEARFTLGRVLGQGATATVYQAFDTLRKTNVALKIFDKAQMIHERGPQSGPYNETAVMRVRRRLTSIVSEIQILKTIDHPNIIAYLEGLNTSHRICLVFELVDDHEDLCGLILKRGRLDEASAAIITKQICSAVAYLHEHNVVHRDLKLENVLLGSDMQVKLIDFGLAAVVTEEDDRLYHICGTPLYCSPEILLLTEEKSRFGIRGRACDVWSIGILVYALSTACSPFGDTSLSEIRKAMQAKVLMVPNALSPGLRCFLAKALNFQVERRFTAQELIQHSWTNVATHLQKDHPSSGLSILRQAETVQRNNAIMGLQATLSSSLEDDSTFFSLG